MASERLALVRLPPLSMQEKNGNKEINLDGPNYQLPGSYTKYNLPRPQALKPHMDSQPGVLEIWPAHTTGQATGSTSIKMTKDKSLLVVDEEQMGKPRLIPRPRFLEQLEGFLKKELRSLGVQEHRPNELRLQAYREVFEYLIEDFKTYKPLLSSIKNEYEIMLAHQREHIRQLEPLRQMLVTVSEHCDQKIMALRAEEKQDMIDLKNENAELYQRISDMKNEQRDLETQVEKLQEELGQEYERYRDECDARKLLISDINDLRYQQEDMALSKQGMQDVDEEDIDPGVMRVALKKSREAEARATRELNQMVANYGDVIPRRDYEALEKKFKELEEGSEAAKTDFTTLQSEHETLLELNKQVTEERDALKAANETLSDRSTPRPDWGRCADQVNGGQVRWKELSENKTSDQLVDVLLNEISGGNIGGLGEAEYFEGKGTADNVPNYLRFEGKVRNRKLGKRDCALFIHEIMKEKACKDAESADGKRCNLGDFLLEFLKARFGLEQMVTEWAYNIDDACQRFSHDNRMAEFYGILSGEIDEEVLHERRKTIGLLMNAFIEKSTDDKIMKDLFKDTLVEFFPGRDEDTIANLVKVAEQELNAKDAETYDFKNLFMEDDEGQNGLFIEEIKKLYKQQQNEYIDEIKMEMVNENPEKVSVENFRKAVAIVDPQIDTPMMNSYLTWSFRCSVDDLGMLEPQPLEDVILRMRNGHIRRIGKRV